MKKMFVIALAIALFPLTASADRIVCVATVKFYGFARVLPGGVFVALEDSGVPNILVCNVQGKFGSVEPAQCQKMFDLISVNFGTPRPLQMTIENAPAGTTSCADLPNNFYAEVSKFFY